MKIEINIGKRHFWAIIGVMVLLAITTIVVAKTTTPAYTDDQPFHETLYADVIAGKSADKVLIDDDITFGGVTRDEWPDTLDCYTADWGDEVWCSGWPEAIPPLCDSGYTFVGIAAETHTDGDCGVSALNRQKVKSRCCRII